MKTTSLSFLALAVSVVALAAYETSSMARAGQIARSSKTASSATRPRALNATTGNLVQINDGSCAPTGNETLVTASYRYQPGQTVKVSGTGYAPSCNLRMTVTGPASESTMKSTDPEGNLSFSYEVGSPAGTYTVAAFMGDDDIPWTSTAFTNGAYVEQDMPDYAPGNRVTITGGGWLPNESVAITIEEIGGSDPVRNYSATADETGNILFDQFETDLGDIGVTFHVKAVGQTSRAKAETKFTDGFQATTRVAGNWNADATWSITRPGKITWSAGSKTVTGDGTGGQDFTVDLAVGNTITGTNDATLIGVIASIDSPTKVTLVANSSTNGTNATYKARRVPAADDDAVITQNVTVTAPASVASITFSINAARILTVNSGQTLNVTGNVYVQGSGTSNVINVNGTFQAGSLTLQGGGNGASTATLNLVGATANLNVSGALTMTAGSASTLLDIPLGSATIGSLSINSNTSGGNISELKIGTGTVTVLGNTAFGGNGSTTKAKLTFTGAGTFEAQGDFGSNGALTTVADSTIRFAGANNASMGSYTTYRKVEVEKTSGAVVTTNGNSTVNGPLSVSSGTLANGSGNTLTAAAGMTVASGATYKIVGSGGLTLGGGVSNEGSVILQGTTAACGEADAVLLRSTVAGTQRAWSGAGQFSVNDVSVQDQGGSAAIAATSSTSVSNNGANWQILATCTTNSTTTLTSSAPSSTVGDSVAFTATVTPGVTSGNVTFIEGGTCAAPGTVLSGPTAVDSTGKVVFTTSALAAGSHTITACYGGSALFNSSNGSVNHIVNKKALTIDGLSASNKPYDGNTTATITGTGSLVGVVGSDVVSLSGTPAGTFASAGVADGISVSVTGLSLTGASAGNYTLTLPTLSANITPLTVTPHVTADNKPYDGGNSATILTRTLTGVLAAEVSNVNLVGGTATFVDATAGNGKTVTATGLSLSGSAAVNYVLSSTSATTTANITTLTVAPEITVENKPYDGNNTANILTRTLTGVLAGDKANVSLSGGTATFADANVGNGKTVTTTGLSLSGSAAVNYVLSTTSASATADITALSVTPHITAENKPYDGNNSATIATRTLSGVLATETVNVTLTGGTATFADANAGNGKTVTATGLSLSGSAALNYVLSSTSATTTANITALTVDPSVTAENKPYDGNNSATILTRTLTGVLASDKDNVTLAGGTAAFADANVANGKQVTVTGLSLSGSAALNYVLSSTSATTTANITALTVDPSVTADNKPYDGNDSATIATRTLSGVLAGDSANVKLTGGTGTFADANVGDGKTVTVTGLSLSGSAALNYVLSSTSATTTANITALTVDPSVTADNKPYDGNDNATILTRTLTGVLATETANVKLTGGTATFADANVGNGKTVTATGLTLSGLAAGNYVLSSTSATTTANITALTVVPGVTVDNKVFDGNTSATILTRTLTGALSGDDVALSGGAATFADANAGTAKAVSVTGLSLSGSTAINYVLSTTSVTTSANIDKAPSVTTVTAVNSMYDGTPHGQTAKVTGMYLDAPVVPVTYTGVAHTGGGDVPYGPTTTAPTIMGDYVATATYVSGPNWLTSTGSSNFVIAKAVDADGDNIPDFIDCSPLKNNRVVYDPNTPTGVMLAAVLPASSLHTTLQAAVTAAVNGDVIAMYIDTKENVVIGSTTNSGGKDIRIVGCGHKITAAVTTKPVVTVEVSAGSNDSKTGNGEGDIHIEDVDVQKGSIGFFIQTSTGSTNKTRTLLKSIRSDSNVTGIKIGESGKPANGNEVRGANSIGSNTGDGIQAFGNSITLDSNRVTSNTLDAIEVNGDSNTITKNKVGDKGTGSKGNGIVVAGASNTINENDVFDSGLLGIKVTGNANQAYKNQVGDKDKGNKGGGILITGDSNLLGKEASQNDVYANIGTGIAIVGNGNVLSKNDVGESGKGNTGDGINVKGNGNTIDQNDVFANGKQSGSTFTGDGINVSGGTSAKPNLIIKNNVGDKGKGNLGNGIVVAGVGNGTGSPNEIEENTVKGNKGIGISVTGSGHQLKDNYSGGSSSQASGGDKNGGCAFNVATGNFNATGNKANGTMISGAMNSAFPTACQGTP